MSQIDTSPASVDIGSLEVFPLGVDVTAYLPTGVTVTSATPTLNDEIAGTGAATNIASSALNGNVLTVTISGLVRNHTYELLVAWRLSNGTTEETRTEIKVPA